MILNRELRYCVIAGDNKLLLLLNSNENVPPWEVAFLIIFGLWLEGAIFLFVFKRGIRLTIYYNILLMFQMKRNIPFWDVTQSMYLIAKIVNKFILIISLC